MIPKIVHYCWFGRGQKSKLTVKCIDTWKKYLHDYQIIEWNEDNCDIDNSCDFVRQAYEQKKWAYVSDFFRLKALIEYGGIYLDTDVEVLKSFDELLNNKLFCCFENEGYICTAVIGSEQKNTKIKAFLDGYYNKEFEQIPNSRLLFEFLIGNRNYKLDKELPLSEREIVYPNYYFSPKDFYTKKINLQDNTFAIHHFDGTWKSGKLKFKDCIQNFLIKILGKEKYFKLKQKVKKNNEIQNKT